MWKLTCKDEYTLEAETSLPEGPVRVELRKGGCMEVHKRYYSGEIQFMHMCDLDGWIEALQSLKILATKEFDGEWPQ